MSVAVVQWIAWLTRPINFKAFKNTLAVFPVFISPVFNFFKESFYELKYIFDSEDIWQLLRNLTTSD